MQRESGGRHPPATNPDSVPQSAPQSAETLTHPGPEHDHPFPLDSNLFVSISEAFRIALNENGIPTSCCEDLHALCLVTPELRVTVWEVLGLPELDTSNPEAPQGIIAAHLKRDKAELMKLSSKFSSKEPVMQYLQAFF
jgi:hypothetical protein